MTGFKIVNNIDVYIYIQEIRSNRYIAIYIYIYIYI